MEKTVAHLISRLDNFWSKDEYLSYDYFDIWSGKLGIFIKKNFYSNFFIKWTIVPIIVLVDLFFPFYRYLFKKKFHPISLAHFGLGYLNLYLKTNDKVYLKKAINIEVILTRIRTNTENGIGWGFSFDWMTIDGLIPANTPCVTQTYYIYEFYCLLNEVSKKSAYENSIDLIANHIYHDYLDEQENDVISAGYSIIDNRKVFNSNSYRANLLINYGVNFNKDEFIEKGLRILNFVIHSQNRDGSWYYSKEEKFIDNFHTCFILKNLMSIQKVLRKTKSKIGSDLDIRIRAGFEYFDKHLIDKSGLPKPFAVKPRAITYKYDIYDFAESLNIYLERSDFDKVEKILRYILERWYNPEGYIPQKKYNFFAFSVPYIRTGNSALFLYLTKLYQYT